ncbi:MAG: SusC/RagA family TonB-linked outer membrane protein [Prolixibacteraceae bacterium]|nr:SusC/RagA family TonB-linked outer membrane protein [Prolixibacteraceae bacterium]
MRIYDLKYKNIRFASLLLLCLFIVGKTFAQDPVEVKIKKVDATLKVTNEQGAAISGATVVIGEGIIHAVTDANGEYSFKAAPNDFVTVSAFGYERNVVLVSDLDVAKPVVLVKAKPFMTSADNVPLPFTTIKKRHLTGGYNVLNGNILDKYPSTDIRNALTGLANGLNVEENHGAPGLTAEESLSVFRFSDKITVSSRGRDMIYIIDEVPTEITEMPLDPGEIESITVVKDIVGKAMFGPAGADGIVFIKTKRGRTNERIINVNVENGVNMVDRFPEFVGGADYARLNNLARTNSGLTPLYSEDDIAAYEKGDPYDMLHPNVNYRDMLLKNSMAFRRANVSSTGGTDKVRYFAYVGYDGDGDIYKIGPKADYNRLNTRSNIDLKVNDFINVQFDFFGGLSFRRSANYTYDPEFTSEGTDNPALDIVEFGTVINDITNLPPIAFPVYANNDPSLKYPWYAVSQSYQQNPIGNMMKNGYYTETSRMGAFNVALDYDMSGILKGLKSRSYIGFNAFNLLRIGKAENYDAYTITPDATVAEGYKLTKHSSHSQVDQSDMAKLHDFYYMRFAAYENLSYEKTFGKNSIEASATYYMSKISRNGIEEPQRQQNGIFSALYSFDDKYNIHGVVNYAGSSSMSEDERYQWSPSIGASWIVSDESFMKDVKFIDYLKLRAETGVLAFESFRGPFGYRDRWNSTTDGTAFGAWTSSQWFGSATDASNPRVVQSRTGNPLLSWEKRRELNAGFDALMFKRKLYMEVNYYNNLRDGIITSPRSLPYVVGISSWLPVFNSDKLRYYGVETALQYTDQKGDFKYSFGGNATIQNTRYEKYDEPAYRFDYQFREGRPSDAIFGQTYLGKFASDAEALEVPQLFDAVLSKDDLKYKDMNGDGVVDDNDQSQIGHAAPRLLYGLNVKLSYKNVDMSIVGTGAAMYDIMMNSKYYRNGWGDNNYSVFVRDNINGAYPRLTYYQINNNFVTSDFWLTKGGYFKIQNVEIAWNVPVKKLAWSGVRQVRLYARGANLLTISKVKDIDPEAPSSGLATVSYGDNDRGSYPLFRTFSGGLKLTF